MSVEPDLSVIVAAYNAADTIEATLRSLLSQTLESIEVLVVDDGSVDGTAKIVDEVRSSDRRVRLISLDTNQGRSAARNRGLIEARGRWIGTCDADDLWAARRAETLVRAAEDHGVDVVTDDQMGFSLGDGGEIHLDHRYASRSTLRMGREHCIRRRGWFFDQTCSMRPIVRAAFLHRCGADYPVRLANGEDLSFYLQLVFDSSAPCILRVGEPLYYYREGESARVTGGFSDAHVLLTSYAADRTGSRELDRWAQQAAPGRRYVDCRFHRRLDRHGRLEGEAGDRPSTEEEGSAIRGWGLLVRRYVLKIVSRFVDRPYRDEITRDVATQLGRPPVA
jgi:glycosyltransferase involved in cell wall biosynthesis